MKTTTKRAVETIKADLDSAVQDQADIEQSMSATRKHREEATAELRARIESIEKPFNDTIEELREHEEESRKAQSQYRKELLQAERRDKIAALDASNTPTPEGIRALLEQYGVNDIDNIALKSKPLSNGLWVFKTTGRWDEGLRYFAFDKRPSKWLLMGYWTKQKSEHPGDDVTGYGWIGVQRMVKSNELEHIENARVKKVIGERGNDWTAWNNKFREEHKFYRQTGSYGGRHDVSSHVFIAELKRLDEQRVREISPIDLQDEDNIKQLSSHYIQVSKQ